MGTRTSVTLRSGFSNQWWSEVSTKVRPTKPAPPPASSNAHILRHARITEKATMHSADSVYVFEVAQNATKRDIVMAIRDIYQITPRMVRIAQIPTKTTRNMRTGVSGIKRGGKKASSGA